MAALAADHQRRIELVADTVATEVRREARKVDVGNVDGWWRARGGAVQQAVSVGNLATAQLGARYLAESALVNGFDLDPVAVAIDAAQLVTALRVTGPVAFKQAVNNTGSVDAARGIMADRLTGSARRLTLAGSRDTVFAAADTTPGIIGYRRVAEAGACKFCKMLEGRGAVYLSRESAAVVVGKNGRPRGTRKLGRAFHDNCRCRIDEIWDETARPAAPSPAPVVDLRAAAREDARADRLRRKANVERIKAEAAAARADLAASRTAAVGDDRVDPEILARWQVTADQYLTAKATTKQVKSDIRAVARAEADNVGGWLFDNDLSQLSRPDRLRRTTNFAGAQVSRRDAAGYDWLEQLDDAELGQVRRRMVDGDLYRPDLLAEVVRAKTNRDMGDDEAMMWLMERWLHEDALRSLASGRLPRYVDPDALIPADYELEGYQLSRLFGVADEDAIGHVAQVQARQATVEAQRMLGTPRRGPAPWEMDAEDYARELEDIEQVLSTTVVDARLGGASPEYEWARLRHRELAPPDIDDQGATNAYELHEAIRITARMAGLLTG